MRILARTFVSCVFAGSFVSAASPSDDARHVIALAELQRSVDPRVVALLDGEPQTAARAALALGRSKKPEARGILRQRLGAANVTLRTFAAYGEGLLADPAALPVEVRLARRDPSSAVRYAAVDAVDRIVGADATLGTPAISAALLDAVAHDPDATVRGHAALALVALRGRPGSTQRASRLADAFARERSADVRWHEMWALFRGYAFVAPRAALVRGLRDSSDVVRIEAVRALGKRGGAGTLQVLQPMVGDRSWRVQEQAREALFQIAKKPFTDHLKLLPMGLHLPAPDAPNTEPTYAPQTGLTPATSTKPQAPTADELLPAIPLVAPNAATLDGPLPGKHPRVRIHTTKGDLVVRLFPEWAPYTVANFLNLTARGYYDNNRWFRIVPDFVVQTGDPNDNGEGDAGYTIPAEENPVEQRSAIISMGMNYENNHPIRDSAGTQFYLTISPQPHLDRDFTVFGELESGMATIARLVESDRMIKVERLQDR